MNKDEIFAKVKKCIMESSDIEGSEINLGDTLINELGLDSIDLIDLLYQLEQTFSISITVGEIESMAREETGSEPFEIDTVITHAGIESLKKLMPEVPGENFKQGITVQEIPFLFNVHSICNLIERKLKKKSK